MHINYRIANAGYVRLKVYDLLGKEIATLVDGFQNAGFMSVKFQNSSLPSGIYIYRIFTDSFTDTKKMVLLK